MSKQLARHRTGGFEALSATAGEILEEYNLSRSSVKRVRESVRRIRPLKARGLSNTCVAPALCAMTAAKKALLAGRAGHHGPKKAPQHQDRCI